MRNRVVETLRRLTSVGMGDQQIAVGRAAFEVLEIADHHRFDRQPFQHRRMRCGHRAPIAQPISVSQDRRSTADPAPRRWRSSCRRNRNARRASRPPTGCAAAAISMARDVR